MKKYKLDDFEKEQLFNLLAISGSGLIFIALVGGAGLIYTSCQKKDINENTKCSLIICNNGGVNIVDNVKNASVEDFYKVEELNDKAIIVYVYDENSHELAEYISNYIYFNQDNTVLFDKEKVSYAGYQSFLEEKKDSKRVRN